MYINQAGQSGLTTIAKINLL